MLPHEMLRPVIIAGVMLAIMSIVDTLSYSVRTAGVLAKRLAISLALFNILVIVSRMSNMFMAPVLGNLPDKVNKEIYTAAQVLAGLRVDLLFVIGGVIIGALITPTFIRLTRRGIEIMEQKGSLPPTVLHGLKRIWRLPFYLQAPSLLRTFQYLDYRTIPINFLIFNIFVTCFYSIGVMSTVLAASWEHSLAGTTILLSGIVNGIASILLFIIVDPPAAVVVDHCIAGKRPEANAKTMNLYLILTRLLGCLLAVVILPLMAQYVLVAARWVDQYFSTGEQTVVSTNYVARTTLVQEGAEYLFGVEQAGKTLSFTLAMTNPSPDPLELVYPSGARFDFAVADDQGANIWRRNEGLRFTQAVQRVTLDPGESISFTADWDFRDTQGRLLPEGTYTFRAKHLLIDAGVDLQTFGRIEIP